MYALSFFVLFLSGHPLTTVPSNFWVIAYVTAFGIALRLIIARGVEPNFLLNRLVLLGLLVIFTLVYGDVNLVAIKFLLFFMLGLVVTMVGRKKDVLLSFAKVNYHLMILAIVCYLAINILRIEAPGYSFLNINEMPYRSVLFYNWFDNSLIYRNTGFYWEPGLLATHAILTAAIFARYDQLFTRQKIIICLTLVSTFSVFSVAILMFLFNRKLNQNIFFLLTVVGAIFILEGLLPNSIIQYFEIVNRKFELYTDSVDHRLISHQITWDIFVNNPLGMGIGNFYAELENTNIPFVSSVIGLAASYPLFLVALSFAFLYRISEEGLSEFKVLLVIFLAANKEPHLLSMIVIIICLGFCGRQHVKID